MGTVPSEFCGNPAVKVQQKVYSRNPKEGAGYSLRSWSKTEWKQLLDLWLELRAGQRASDMGPRGLDT